MNFDVSVLENKPIVCHSGADYETSSRCPTACDPGGLSNDKNGIQIESLRDTNWAFSRDPPVRNL
jgi:hypothetical protein